MNETKTRRKIAVGVIAALASLSVMVGGVFDSSKEILDESSKPDKDKISNVGEQQAVSEQTVLMQKIAQKIRGLIYKVPVKVRSVVFVPLWAIGSAILWAGDLFFSTLIAPFVHVIASFLLQTLVVFGIVALCVKILFPDLPLKKIVSKKMLLSVLAGSAFVCFCDLIVPRFWEGYGSFRNVTRVGLILLVIAIILSPFIRKKLKDPVSYEIVYNGVTIG